LRLVAPTVILMAHRLEGKGGQVVTQTLRKLVARVFRGISLDESGQGLTEYALILALIAIIAIAALTLLGGSVSSVLSTVANSI
jgi:pilus assembly protein Flp/PilA